MDDGRIKSLRHLILRYVEIISRIFSLFFGEKRPTVLSEQPFSLSPSFSLSLSLTLSLFFSHTHTHTGSTDATKHGMRERKKVTFILATLFSVTREGRIKQVSLYDNVIVVYVVNVVSVVFVGVVVDIVVVVANLNRAQNSSQFFPEIVS